MKSSRSIGVLIITCLQLISLVQSGCPFQNPFWFVEKPVIVPVTDENNNVIPNKVRVLWGRLENFKCVDYFQVEYFQRSNPAATVMLTPRINRHRRSVEVEILPCTEYFFKVIASEDWKGMREDFKMFSEVVSFKLDYTPRFINPPMVKERAKMTPEQERAELRAQLREQRRRQRMRQNSYYGRYGNMVADQNEETTMPSQKDQMIYVRWRLADIDYPNCLDYIVLDYYDTLYNESGFSRTFARPFPDSRFEFEIQSAMVPCEIDFEFIVRVFGLTGEQTLSDWTPPSCVVTTLPPETTTPFVPEEEETEATTEIEVTTENWSAKLEAIQRENERLQTKINGLRQEYEKIGLQVFHAFKESFFQGLEDFLARRKSKSDNNGGGLFVPVVENQTESSSLFGK